SKEEVLVIGVDENALEKEVEPIYLKRYLTAIKSKHITERVIIKKGSYKLDSKNISYRELAPEFIGNVAQIIYANKVALFLAGNTYTLIIIQSKQTTETYRKQFELLWKSASS
ncbi:MAG: hypothetical protein Q7K43_04860, partial [Candidatus Woesearchaeota archaeon]|nr:hypothetical protein [Candidatus Woesearchaeota archaeon]